MNYTPTRHLPDRRKSRQASEVEDPYPAERFVRCTDDLTVLDLAPGTWTLTPSGKAMRRDHYGTIFEYQEMVH